MRQSKNNCDKICNIDKSQIKNYSISISEVLYGRLSRYQGMLKMSMKNLAIALIYDFIDMISAPGEKGYAQTEPKIIVNDALREYKADMAKNNCKKTDTDKNKKEQKNTCKKINFRVTGYVNKCIDDIQISLHEFQKQEIIIAALWIGHKKLGQILNCYIHAFKDEISRRYYEYKEEEHMLLDILGIPKTDFAKFSTAYMLYYITQNTSDKIRGSQDFFAFMNRHIFNLSPITECPDQKKSDAV